MKKVVLLVIVFVSLFSLAACDTSPTPAAQPTPQVTQAPQISEYDIIDSFISSYNVSASFPLNELSPMDIQGDDYRTEFRLNAFKSAVGMKVVTESATVEIVNYGVRKNDYLRFYARFDNYDSALQFVFDVVHILDRSISDDDISGEFSGFEHTGTANIYLGTAGYISGYLDTKYANGGVSGYEVFIDCTDMSGFYE